MKDDGKPHRRGPRKRRPHATAAAWNDKIGARVEEVRQTFALTQEELAGLLAVSRVSMNKIENGVTALSLEQAVRLTRSLHLSLDAFVETQQIAPEILGLQHDVAPLPPATIGVLRQIAQMFLQELQRYRQQYGESPA